MERPLRLGFLASHGGTAFKYIHDAINQGKLNAEIVAFVSNNSKSEAMKFAREHYPDSSHHVSSKTHENPDKAIAEIMMKVGIDYMIFSGWMKPGSSDLIEPFKNRVINPHPGDTKKHGGPGMYGDAVHASVLASGEKLTRPTIHLVESDGIDTGKILSQGVVDILPEDTIESLSERVKPVECKLLLSVLQTLEPVS